MILRKQNVTAGQIEAWTDERMDTLKTVYTLQTQFAAILWIICILDFNENSLSRYDFSTLYTTLPHNFIKDKLIDLIERTFQREGSPKLACNDKNAFLLQKN